MILGYDHGLGVTFDGGKAWYQPDHMPMGQFYAIDFDMSFPYRVAGGLQDNGSLMGPGTNKDGAAIRMKTGPRSAAATACTTSSTRRPIATSTTRASSARSRGSTC